MIITLRLFTLIAALVSCGVQETKEVKVPVESSSPAPAPIASTPDPQYLPQPQAPQVPVVDSAPQSDTNLVDPFGVPYEPTAEVPYAPEYAGQAPSQYNPAVPAYYAEVEQYMGVVAQPLQPFSVELPMPLLYDRYCQQRAFLNYQPSFRRVLIGDGRWDRSRYDRTRSQFDRSQRWVNYELYRLINETLDSLSRRKYHSSRGLEAQIREAIRRRDHRLAARLHDDLLQEAGRGHGRDDRRADDRGGRDDNRGGRDDNRGGRDDNRGGRDDNRGGRDDNRSRRDDRDEREGRRIVE